MLILLYDRIYTLLQGYGFEVDKLYEVLLEIRYIVYIRIIWYVAISVLYACREHYDDLLMKTWGSAFT